jgi:arabinofuranosyltransferase
VYDLHGLGDVMVARVALDHRGTPGHEKMLPAPWAVARFVDPSVAVDPSDFSPGGLTVMLPGVDLIVDEADFEDDTAAARRALDCGDLAELFENTRDPLTPELFLGNIVDSVRLDDFRYPADPQEAEAQLCS